MAYFAYGTDPDPATLQVRMVDILVRLGYSWQEGIRAFTKHVSPGNKSVIDGLVATAEITIYSEPRGSFPEYMRTGCNDLPGCNYEVMFNGIGYPPHSVMADSPAQSRGIPQDLLAFLMRYPNAVVERAVGGKILDANHSEIKYVPVTCQQLEQMVTPA